jgi:hypothetical protein
MEENKMKKSVFITLIMAIAMISFMLADDKIHSTGRVLVYFNRHITDAELGTFIERYAKYEFESISRQQEPILLGDFSYNFRLLPDRLMDDIVGNDNIVRRLSIDQGVKRPNTTRTDNIFPWSIMIIFHDDVTASQVDDMLVKYTQYYLRKQSFVHGLLSLNIPIFGSFLYDYALVEDVDLLLSQINSENIVKQAFFGGYLKVRANMASNSYMTEQWYLDKIEAPKAWDLVNRLPGNSREPVIAVLDRGHHYFSKLFDSRYVNYLESPYILEYVSNGVLNYLFDYVDNDNNGYYGDYWAWNAVTKDGMMHAPLQRNISDVHGTHVSGIMSYTSSHYGLTGITHNFNDIKFFPIDCSDILDPEYQQVDIQSIVDAMHYVLRSRYSYNHPDSTGGAFFVAINCSFGMENATTEQDSILRLFIDSLGMVGVLTIVSAGDTGIDIDDDHDPVVSQILDSPFLINVTASGRNDEILSWADHGFSRVDIAAPGVDIPGMIEWYPYNTTNNFIYGISYDMWGTSFSAPMVSATIGLLYKAASDSYLDSFDSQPYNLALSMKYYIKGFGSPLPEAYRFYTTNSTRLNAFQSLRGLLFYPFTAIDDTTFTGWDFDLHKILIVDNGAFVVIDQGIIQLPSANPSDLTSLWGFEIRNGMLTFRDSQAILGDIFIEAITNTGDVKIQGSGGNRNLASALYFDGGALEFANGGGLSVENAMLSIDNGTLNISSGSRADFESNSSILTNRSFIFVDNAYLNVFSSMLSLQNSTLLATGSETEILVDYESEMIADNGIIHISDGANFIFDLQTINLSNGSIFSMSGDSTKVAFSENSQLIINSNSLLEITDGSSIHFSAMSLGLSDGGILRVSGVGSEIVFDELSIIEIGGSSSIEVLNGGRVVFMGTNVTLSDGGSIKACGMGSEVSFDEESEINILSGSIFEVVNGATIDFSGMSITLSDGGILRVSGVGSEIVFDELSVIDIDGSSSIEVLGGGRVVFMGTNIAFSDGGAINISGVGSEVVFGEDSAFDMYEGNISISGGGVADFSAIDFALSGSSRMSLSGEGSQAIFADEGIITIEAESSFEVSDGAILSLLGMTVHISGESALWVDGSESGLIFSEASELHLSAGSIFRVSDGAETLFENNGILSSIESAVCLSDSASIYFHGTDFIMADATLSLSGGSGESLFTMVATSSR